MKEIAPRIVVDPTIRFGQPIIKGTRITADEVLGFVAAGMANEEIKKEYGLSKEDILAAVKYASSFVKGERVKLLKPVRA